MKREHIVNQIREIVHRVAPTALAILYGSEARGDAREDVSSGHRKDAQSILEQCFGRTCTKDTQPVKAC